MKPEAFVQSDFTSPEFIGKLRSILVDLRVRAYLYRDSSGERFSQDIIADPLFRAVYSWRRWVAERPEICAMLEGAQGDLRQKLQMILQKGDEEYQQHEQLIVAKILQFLRSDLSILQRLVRFSGLIEKQFVKGPQADRKKLDWKYCAGAVTLQFLIRGVVPIKKQVREAVLREMAINRLPAGSSNQKIAAEIAKLRAYCPRQWAKIFNALGLADLPPAPNTRIVKCRKPHLV